MNHGKETKVTKLLKQSDFIMTAAFIILKGQHLNIKSFKTLITPLS